MNTLLRALQRQRLCLAIDSSTKRRTLEKLLLLLFQVHVFVLTCEASSDHLCCLQLNLSRNFRVHLAASVFKPGILSLAPTKDALKLGVMVDDQRTFSDQVTSMFRSCCFTYRWSLTSCWYNHGDLLHPLL